MRVRKLQPLVSYWAFERASTNCVVGTYWHSTGSFIRGIRSTLVRHRVRSPSMVRYWAPF